jgi:hypothetical protein
LNVFKKSIDKHERVDYKKYHDCMNKLTEEQNKDFNVDEYMKDFTEEKFLADAAKSEAQKKKIVNIVLINSLKIFSLYNIFLL